VPDTLTEPFRLDDQIGHLLRQAYRTASAHLAQRLAAHNLKPQQFATLARLRELGATSQNFLGEAVGMERANIHAMVERLRKKGLVDTRADPGDARRRLVELTGDGRTLVETLIPLDLESTEDALAPLNENERKTLYRLLRQLCHANA
jgi:MarR family transcriptional regulator, lower aerobic nicotinate degradation pathway regulator